MPTKVRRYLNTASTAGGDGTTDLTAGGNRAWATLNEALGGLNAAFPSGFPAADVQVDLVASTGGGITQDTAALSNPWPTSDLTRYLHLQVPPADRKVAYSSAVYTYARTVNFAPALAIATHTLYLTGVQVYHVGNLDVGGNHGIGITSLGGALVMDGVKVFKFNNAGQAAVFGSGVTGTIVLRNCNLGFNNIGGGSFGFRQGVNLIALPSDTEVVLYNLTFVGGGGVLDGIIVAFNGGATNAVARVKNCLTQGATNGVTITNATTTDTATNHHSTVTDAVFVSGSNRELQGTDTVARDQGTDLSAVASWPFDWDGNGFLRPINSVWDIGCHEYGSTVAPRRGRAFTPGFLG